MTRRGAGRPDRGAATVLVVAMAGVLMFVMLGLAALGGASELTDACGAAARIAAAHAAALDGCRVEGDEVAVAVSVPGPDVPWGEVRVTAEARAGPG
jgi:hypothetical protein